jgi:hypothetical protein
MVMIRIAASLGGERNDARKALENSFHPYGFRRSGLRPSIPSCLADDRQRKRLFAHSTASGIASLYLTGTQSA